MMLNRFLSGDQLLSTNYIDMALWSKALFTVQNLFLNICTEKWLVMYEAKKSEQFFSDK